MQIISPLCFDNCGSCELKERTILLMVKSNYRYSHCGLQPVLSEGIPKSTSPTGLHLGASWASSPLQPQSWDFPFRFRRTYHEYIYRTDLLRDFKPCSLERPRAVEWLGIPTLPNLRGKPAFFTGSCRVYGFIFPGPGFPTFQRSKPLESGQLFANVTHNISFFLFLARWWGVLFMRWPNNGQIPAPGERTFMARGLSPVLCLSDHTRQTTHVFRERRQRLL
jgi:hypothetical protein